MTLLTKVIDYFWNNVINRQLDYSTTGCNTTLCFLLRLEGRGAQAIPAAKELWKKTLWWPPGLETGPVQPRQRRQLLVHADSFTSCFNGDSGGGGRGWRRRAEVGEVEGMAGESRARRRCSDSNEVSNEKLSATGRRQRSPRQRGDAHTHTHTQYTRANAAARRRPANYHPPASQAAAGRSLRHVWRGLWCGRGSPEEPPCRAPPSPCCIGPHLHAACRPARYFRSVVCAARWGWQMEGILLQETTTSKSCGTFFWQLCL